MNIRLVCVALVLFVAGCCEHCHRRMSPPQTQPATATPPSAEMQELAMLMSGQAPMEAPASVGLLRQHSFEEVGADTDASIDPSGQWMVFASTAYSRRPDIFIKAVDGKAITQLTNDPASDIQPAISPDGKSIAFTSNRSGSWEIYVMGVDGKSLRQVTRGGGANMHPSWSGDGSRLVYCCQGAASGQWEMWVTSLNAPAARQFVGYGMFPAWNPKEDLIAYQRSRTYGDRVFGIWTVHLGANGEPSMPTAVLTSDNRAYVSPSFSADGKRIVCTAVEIQGPNASADIYVVDLNGDNQARLTQGMGRKFGPTWGGERIFFSCNRDGHENIWSVADNAAAGPSVTATEVKGASVAKAAP